MVLPIERARHLLKTAIPREYRFLGVSFPNPELTKSIYLEPIGNDIYTVKDSKLAVTTRSGVVRVGWNFLDVDYGPFSAFRSILLPCWTKAFYPRVLPLWSHDWSTYYHWLIDVAPKIAAAKLHFGTKMEEITFIYPRPLTDYEIDTIEMLGVRPDRFVNPHRVGEIRSDQIFVSPLAGWVNISPRVFKLRQSLMAPSYTKRRLYVARNGTRRVINEPELFKMLECYGFEFIRDCSRSLAEQIKLFGSASYIIAPHGAALSNILWANETVRILELANSAYAPDYFVNLSSVLQIRLDRLKFGVRRNHWSNNPKDFLVDVRIVNRFIEEEWGLAK
jgi:hypothetical protein